MNSHFEALVRLIFNALEDLFFAFLKCLALEIGSLTSRGSVVGGDFPLIMLGTQIILFVRATHGSSKVVFFGWPLVGLHLDEPVQATCKDRVQFNVSVDCSSPACS